MLGPQRQGAYPGARAARVRSAPGSTDPCCPPCASLVGIQYRDVHLLFAGQVVGVGQGSMVNLQPVPPTRDPLGAKRDDEATPCGNPSPDRVLGVLASRHEECSNELQHAGKLPAVTDGRWPGTESQRTFFGRSHLLTSGTTPSRDLQTAPSRPPDLDYRGVIGLEGPLTSSASRQIALESCGQMPDGERSGSHSDPEATVGKRGATVHFASVAAVAIDLPHHAFYRA